MKKRHSYVSPSLSYHSSFSRNATPPSRMRSAFCKPKTADTASRNLAVHLSKWSVLCKGELTRCAVWLPQADRSTEAEDLYRLTALPVLLVSLPPRTPGLHRLCIAVKNESAPICVPPPGPRICRRNQTERDTAKQMRSGASGATAPYANSMGERSDVSSKEMKSGELRRRAARADVNAGTLQMFRPSNPSLTTVSVNPA